MNVPARLTAFTAVLGLTFGGAALAGAAVNSTDGQPATGRHADAPDAPGGHGAHGGGAVGGLAVTDGDYTLETDGGLFTAGQTAPFTFRITDHRGRVVRDAYQVEQEKELHLIVVRRDTAVFDHVHPRKGADGAWSVDLNLPVPGVYRAYADFTIGGERRTLATDLFVPGNFQPKPFPTSEPTARTVDTAGGRLGRGTGSTRLAYRPGVDPDLRSGPQWAAVRRPRSLPRRQGSPRGPP